VVFDHFGESQTFPPRLFYRSKNGEKKGMLSPKILQVQYIAQYEVHFESDIAPYRVHFGLKMANYCLRDL